MIKKIHDLKFGIYNEDVVVEYDEISGIYVQVVITRNNKEYFKIWHGNSDNRKISYISIFKPKYLYGSKLTNLEKNKFIEIISKNKDKIQSIYNEYYNNDEEFNKKVDFISDIVFPDYSKLKIIKEWGITQKDPKIIDRKDLSDKDFDELNSLFKKMLDTNNYMVYKGYFSKVCKILNFDPSVIISYKLKKGSEKDKNSVYIRYETKNKEIPIPNGYSLYHISPCSTIKELEPKFKGKSPRNYFYSTPRVYCSINKSMSKGYAQFKGKQKNVGLTKYQIDESIHKAYLDDRIGNIMSGAVYIETQFPIKVTKV